MPAEKFHNKHRDDKAPGLTAGSNVRPSLSASLADDGHCPLVAIGGSAGSLEALQQFFHALPASTGLSFVVVVHLSPTSPSALPELLQHWTALRVCSVRHMQRVQPDHVYVIPAGRYLTCKPGYLQLGARSATVPRRLTIDVFMRSLAESYGPWAAAIVLSGADKDGSMGIQQIKARGGLTLAQDPTVATYPMMPQSAIATGSVDAIVHPRDMPLRVVEHFSQLPRRGDGAVPDLSVREPHRAGIQLTDTLEQALHIIRERTGQDYARYRRPTLLRRLEHRIEMSGADSAPEYLSLLQESREETDTLGREFLISVTRFFRDPQHFDLLAKTIPELFEGKGTDDVVRVWVPGCATGEEAYSIVMLLLEYAEQSSASAAVQVFGTDLDVAAIMAARSGHYSHDIERHLTADRLHRFFATDASGYRARRDVREPLLFAVHDLLKDAPFAHMDLVSCRNLLIYLTAEAQQEVLQTLHFSLRPGGLLFLGSAEGAEDRLFSPLGTAHKLYRRLPGGRSSARVTAAKHLLARSRDLHSPVHEISSLVGTSAIEPSPVSSPDQAINRHLSSRELSSADLRASNQELFVINQELRAATEELDINRQELQCINEELTVLNQQLSLSIDELTRVNSDLKNFIDATDLGIIFLDRHLKIMRYTPAATRLFRLIPTDLGRPLLDLRHDLLYDRFEDDVRIVLSGALDIEREVEDHNGRWFLTRIMPYRTIELKIVGVMLTFVDVTERKRTEAHQAFLAGIADELSGLLLPAEIMDSVGLKLGAYLKVNSCTFVDVDDEGGDVTVYQGWPTPDEPTVYQTFRLTDYLTDELSRTNRAGDVFVMRHIGDDHCLHSAAHADVEVGAMLNVPFHREGRWIASLGVTNSEPREWRDDEIELVRDIADRVFPRIERARAEQDLHITEERMRYQKEVFQAAIDGASLEYCLHLLARLVTQEMAGKARTSFYMIDPEGRCLHPVYGAGDMPHSYLKQVDGFLIGESPLACGLADQTGRPVVTLDVFEEPAWKPWLHLAEAHGFRGCWSFPIKTRENKAVGKLVMLFEAAREAGARERALADIVTQSAAIIISNHLEAQERTRAEAALRESEERVRAFVAATSNIVYVMSADWSTMHRLVGKDLIASLERPRGDWMDAYIPQSDRLLFRQTIEQAIRTKTLFELEHRVIRMDGTIGRVSSRAVPIKDQHGDIVEWFGTASDISHMTHSRQAG